MAVDPAGKRLFVSALGNGSLEVIDLEAGKRAQRAGSNRDNRASRHCDNGQASYCRAGSV